MAHRHTRLYAAFLNVIKIEWFNVMLQGTPQWNLVLTGRALAREFFLDFVTYSITSQNPALLAVLVEKVIEQRSQKAYWLRGVEILKKNLKKQLPKDWFIQICFSRKISLRLATIFHGRLLKRRARQKQMAC